MNDDQSFKKTKSADARFEEPTFIDPLTGIFNRYYLDQFVPQEIRKASLNNYPISCMMIDVDKFKRINDGYGHLCGDSVLTQIAGILKRSIRQTDILIRYAGDEFIVILSGAGSERTASICSKMISEVEKNEFKGDKNQNVNVTLSIGYAVYPEDAQEQKQLIDMADKALYLSKKRGRNRFSSAKEVTTEEVSSLIAVNSFPCRKFINRENELSKLMQLFDVSINSNLLQAAFISGPSGVGKSRILSEIKGYIKNQGILIYYNSSSPHAQDPYYLFAKGIGSYIEIANAEDPMITDILLNMPMPEISELSLIMPQLRNIVKKSTELSGDDKGKRFLLFKAFLDLLIQLNNASPVIIIFDDIHWADKASLELLHYLIKQEKKRSLFLICAFSDDKLFGEASGEALQNLLKEIDREGNVTNIKLTDLSLQNAIMMVDAIFPGTAKAKKFPPLVYEITKGNPYFIEEILKFLVEKGMIFYHKDSWQVDKDIKAEDIPSSLEEVIKSRLINLDDETKEMILQAAVIGKNFQADTLKKIGDMNEGFVSELIERAKNLHLVDETEKNGKFNFINDKTQDILYKELNADKRNKIHYRIAQVLVDEHKDNLYDIAGEAAFHYSHAPSQEKSALFSKELLVKTAELFNPNEIAEYLEQLTQSFLSRKGKIAAELNERMIKEAFKFVLLFQGAVKKYRLYPPTSPVRLSIARDAYQPLSIIFHEADSLVISEVEKSMVINGRRLSPSEAEHSNAGDFLYKMMEHGIKTISFKKGLREDELARVINHLSQTSKDIIDSGGWAAVINKEGLEHIGIDELHFISVDEYASNKQGGREMQDLMLVEFLLGKIDDTAINKEEIIYNIAKNPKKIAQTITDIANIARDKDKNQDDARVISDIMAKIDSQILNGKHRGGDKSEDMAKVMLELEPNLRKKVMDSFASESRPDRKKVTSGIINAITDEFLINTIIEKYKDNMRNPLIAREFLEDILINEVRKKEILPKLESELAKLDIDEKDLSFIIGKTSWESLSLASRVDMLLGLPQDYYYGGILVKIKNILSEFERDGKKEELKDAIYRLLVKTKKIDEKSRKNLLRAIIDFAEDPFVNNTEDYFKKSGVVDFISEKLETEKDAAILACVLEIVKQIIYDFTSDGLEPIDGTLKVRKDGSQKIFFAQQIFDIVFKRLKTGDNKDAQICELINNFISDISNTPLPKILACRIIEGAQKSKYSIKELSLIFKDKVVDALTDIATKNSTNLKDPFEEFMIRKRIALLLIELKDMSLNRLKNILSDNKEGVSVPLIELIGCLENEQLIDPLLHFVRSADPAIRMATVQALSEIGGQKSIEALSNIAKEEQNANIRDLANIRLQKLKKKIPPH